MSPLPQHARIVIVGAGIVGCSAAYHLTQLGWRDVVVVDQGPLYETGGSTSHAPGITFGTNPSRLMQKMVKYTTDLLHGKTFLGEQVWYPVGTVEVATTEARLQELWRRHGHALAYDAPSRMMTANEVREIYPFINVNMIKGGLHRPSDGNARAWKAAGALALEAEKGGGAAFYGEVNVQELLLDNGRITGVRTDKGDIVSDQVLLCTNIWGSILADKIGVKLPMMACSHHYANTEPLPELAGYKNWIDLPPLRHQDKSAYFRQWDQRWSVGSYRHEPWLVSPYDVGKDAYWDWRDDGWETAAADAEEMFPFLKGRTYEEKINGMFVFTTDGFPLMGPTAVPGCWTAIGIWVTHAGGAGKCIAEWMDSGHTEWDVHEADVNRFHAFQKTNFFIQTRSHQNYVEVYDIIHPKQQMENPRNVRLAPYHSRLVDQQAVFWPAAGWETARWYDANARLLEKYDDQIPERTGWEAQEWSRIEGAEHLAVRENGGLFNLANFTKLEVSGPGALTFLNYMAANQIDRPIGKITYTTLLDNAGGIKADLTITRTGDDTFWVLTGAGGGPQDAAWLTRNMPGDGSVQIRDLTSQYTAIGLWGPRARDVLAKVVDEDISNAAFPYMTASRITIRAVPCFALRLSYAGELGWEIYCATEQGLQLWDHLWYAGREYGLIAAGSGAFGSLRLEKGYRAWGSDLNTEHTPYDAGLGWAVKLDKGDFLGRAALVAARKRGQTRRLCILTSSAADAMAMGSEPVLDLNGNKIGYVTSAEYGYSVGKLVMMAYLPIDYAKPGQELQIMYLDRSFRVFVDKDPLFDTAMARLKA